MTLRDFCVIGRAGCQNRPSFRAVPISEEEYRGSEALTSFTTSIPLPEELKSLHESGKDNEYYLGENLIFFSPSYVQYLYRSTNPLVDVAVARGKPVTVWSFDPKKNVMVSDRDTKEFSFWDFVVEYI